MTRRDPPDVAILAARLARAYHASLSSYSCASLSVELCAIERAQRRHAERSCNGDYDRSPDPRHVASNIEVGIAEQRAGERIARRIKEWQKRRKGLLDLTGKVGADAARWDLPDVPITLQGDPRGPVLLLRLPGEPEAVPV